MKMRVHIRLLLIIIGIYALIYVIVGIQQSNFYGRISSARARTASTDQGDIQIGVLYDTNDNYTSFLDGVNLAITEVNTTKNSVGEKGILFKLPGGLGSISRRIRPLYLPVRGSTNLTISSPLVSTLTWKKHLVAIVSQLAASMTQRTFVIPEYYGIANIAIRPTLPSLTQQDFKYFVRTVPNYHDIARHFMGPLLLTVEKRTGKKVKNIGILFSTALPEGYRKTLIEEREKANERIKLIECLRRGFEKGILNDANDIEDLRDSKYVHTGLGIDSIEAKRFIEDNLDETEIKTPLKLKELVTRYDRHETPAQISYVKAFMTKQKDYRPLIMSAEKTKTDVIIISASVSDSVNLIRQIREMGVTTPVVVFHITDYAKLITMPWDRLTNVYTASIFDPSFEKENMKSFNERYKQYLISLGKEAIPPDFYAIQGYEAIHLIAQAIEKNSSAVPINICNSLKYAPAPLKGKVFDEFSFTPEGDIQNRKLYTLYFDEGKITVIREQE